MTRPAHSPVVTRRRLLTGGVALGALTLLAACGGGSASPTSAPAANAAPSAAPAISSAPAASTAPSTTASTSTRAAATSTRAATATGVPAVTFPLAFAHKYGTTTIPRVPQRVVTVGFNEQDFALAVGVKPVGVRQWLGAYAFQNRPWARSLQGGDLPTIGGQEIDYERIAGLRPDLILGMYAYLKPEEYQRLSALAPTVVQPAEYPDGGIPWQQQQILTGRILGQEARARELVAGIEARYARERTANPQFAGKSAAFGFFNNNGFTLFSATDIRTQFLTELGFRLSAETGPISRERAQALDQDALVAVMPRADFEGDPLYGQLRVAREGRAIYFKDYTEDLPNAIGFNSPLSLQFLLDGIVPRLVAAVDGNPATSTDGPAGR